MTTTMTDSCPCRTGLGASADEAMRKPDLGTCRYSLAVRLLAAAGGAEASQSYSSAWWHDVRRAQASSSGAYWLQVLQDLRGILTGEMTALAGGRLAKLGCLGAMAALDKVQGVHLSRLCCPRCPRRDLLEQLAPDVATAARPGVLHR